MPLRLAALAVTGLAGGAGLWAAVREGPQQAQVRRGGITYAAQCAGCHGAAGEGQPGWQRPGPDGLLPAPPHDASGHTWQHADTELRALILQGPAGGGAPAGYRSAMPAYAGRLTPAEVDDVIAWIKAGWPPGVRAWQAAQNPGGPPVDSLPGDWRFPVTCKPGWVEGG